MQKDIQCTVVKRGIKIVFSVIVSTCSFHFLFVWTSLFVYRHVHGLTLIPCVGDCLIVRDQLKYALSFQRSVGLVVLAYSWVPNKRVGWKKCE